MPSFTPGVGESQPNLSKHRREGVFQRVKGWLARTGEEPTSTTTGTVQASPEAQPPTMAEKVEAERWIKGQTGE